MFSLSLSLPFLLTLSLCSSFYLHFTLRLYFSFYRSRLSYSLSFHLSPFLDLSAFTFYSPRHAGRSFVLVTTFLPTEPPTPRLYNDVNSHAHVFKSPHYSRDLRPDSWSRTRFLTSKATVAFSSRGVPARDYRTLYAFCNGNLRFNEFNEFPIMLFANNIFIYNI